MSELKKIKSALVSVYHKDGLDSILHQLADADVRIYSTGGTQKHIEGLGLPVTAVEELTTYPSILGGRVKTLHPKVFGGILSRRELQEDVLQLEEYDIPEIDLVIVDLYPFEETVASGGSEQEVIEKIDIGGISLIRAAAKNFKDVLTVATMKQYPALNALLAEQKGFSTLEDRKAFAKTAFNVSSHYDSAIFGYFDEEQSGLKVSHEEGRTLRYGENPHQQGRFYGKLEDVFEQLHGKELSYNNLLDLDAAVCLMEDLKTLDGCAFAVLKHNNACGCAVRSNLLDAWTDALAGDPTSAFGGVLITNKTVDAATAEGIDQIFFEVIAAPSYSDEALEVLQKKKNRIILVQKETSYPEKLLRSALNGVLVEDRDTALHSTENLELKTDRAATSAEVEDLLFANILVKHTKSNCIVLAKNGQLVASGTGQTSRVDALEQAISKAGKFKFDLNGAVMASDAFFPFPDCVEIAGKAGITAVVQPGGSIKDQLSIDKCNTLNMSMVFTGKRHFKH